MRSAAGLVRAFGYDLLVAPDGGDFDLLSEACAFAGVGGRILVTGSLSESDDIGILDNQHIDFINTEIAFAAGNYLIMSGNDAVLNGNLDITGDGNSVAALLYATGDRILAGGCRVILNPTDAVVSNTGQQIRVAQIDSDYSVFNMRVTAWTFSSDGGAFQVEAFLLSAAAYNKLFLTVDHLQDTHASAPNVFGIELASASMYNTVIALVKDCTTDTGNNGKGIVMSGGNNYNSIIGSARGCDNANLVDNGTGNKTGEVAV